MTGADDGFKLDQERVGGGWVGRRGRNDLEVNAVDCRIRRQESGDMSGLRGGDGWLGGDESNTAVVGN